MKKDYINPIFEIITLESENVLAESSKDDEGWYPDIQL